MNKYVIYTIVTGGYDDVLQPLEIDERFDYILFSNDISLPTIGVWKVRTIPIVVQNDNKRLSRYPKSHPEALLCDYKASLYIDANIQIKDNWIYDRVIELFDNGIEYAGIKMAVSNRDCIYEHAIDMCVMGVEHDYVAIRQCHELWKRGFPRHFGLNENNVIYRCHTERMKQADEEWWWWITNYSFRDQFSYMFCLWKYGITLCYLLPEGEDTRNSLHFNFIAHNSSGNVKAKKYIKKGFLEWLRTKSYSFNEKDYYAKWIELCKRDNPNLFLIWWGIFISIKELGNIMAEYFIKAIHKLDWESFKANY